MKAVREKKNPQHFVAECQCYGRCRILVLIVWHNFLTPEFIGEFDSKKFLRTVLLLAPDRCWERKIINKLCVFVVRLCKDCKYPT